jgi:predicted AAA+ superfamily ATPase
MNRRDPGALLQRALELSRQILGEAERGDARGTASLSAERLQQLRAARVASPSFDSGARAILAEISALNDRAIGALEHQRRIKERQLDTVATGRRALSAYGSVRPQR